MSARNQLTSAGTALTASLLGHKYQKDKSKGSWYSHGSLDGAFGGTFYYEDNEMKAFYGLVAEAFERKSKYYLNEINGKHRTFVLELDLCSLRTRFDPAKDHEARARWEAEITSELQTLVREATDVMATYYEDKYARNSSLFEAIVEARAPDFDGAKAEGLGALENRGLTRTMGDRVPCSEGAHVYFKNLIVDEARSLQMHAHIVEHLKGIDRANPGKLMPFSGSNWDHVVDPLIYAPRSGVRLFGASKSETCKACNNDPSIKVRCATCTGVGKVDKGRVYDRVLFVTEGSGSLDPRAAESYRRDVTRLLIDTSLRKDASALTDGYRVPDVAPKTHAIKKFDNKTSPNLLDGRPARYNAKSATSGIYCPDPYAAAKVKDSGKRGREFEPARLTDEQYAVAMAIVRGLSPAFYGKLEMHEAFRQENPPLLKIQVKGPGCQYCHNIAYRVGKEIKTGGRHNSHVVFFEIDPTQVRQGCTDNCEPGRRTDPNAAKLRKTNHKCTTYLKNPILYAKISADQSRVLFPGLGDPALFAGVKSSIIQLDYTKLVGGPTLTAASAHYVGELVHSINKRRKVLRLDELAKMIESES